MSNGKKFVGLAAMLAVASCASEAPPRSYVQPNIIKKSDLTGTWYYIQTAIDAPPTSGTMFMGNSSELLKIRFDIQEDFLYARRSYEWIVGSSDAATAQGPDYKGDILAAWKISSQFDIIRDFNSTTGEQTNKIIEDQSRPWDQREFIRVDWSQNLTTDLKGIGLEMFFSEEYPQIEPISYWVSDPTSPDALHMERAQSDNPQEGFKAGEMTYLDIVDQVVVTPPMRTISFEENGVPYSFTIPTCPDFGLNSYDQRDCTEQTYKIRHAFAKIGPNHDYEARNWDGLQMNLFGIWDVGLRRLTYNRQYGVTNSGFDRHAARFNIWQKSYCAI